ncbi:MAG TPA: peptidylprolyl isomerase [Candidatus Blautia stercoravium]|nr:peptidylprolyl isomerase [Candidatus Blautia stercoravium]
MKKTTALLLAGVLTAALFTGCGTKEESKKESSSQTENSQNKETAEKQTDNSAGTKVEIAVKDYGTIEVALDKEAAPLTVENFLKLTEEGFYDGLTFHRIIDGFMIQGGDPKGNGTGGSDETIKGEFSENGVENSLSHTRGAISMARSQDYDSASSQFFIVQKDSTYLDGQYAAFGYVTEGMDVVDKICKDVSVEDQNGTVLPENQPVIETIKVVK